jgi:putative flippase GtrA
MAKLMSHYVKVRFVVVGIWNTIFGYGIFCLFETLFTRHFSTKFAGYMVAMVVAQVLSVTNAYICHKFITFRSKAKGKAIIAEYFRFYATYIVTFVIGLVLLPAFVEIVGITPKIAAAVITLICMVVSYLGHSRFSFK